ncbi:hypothetical protein ACFQZC_33685 [Streptacidiphilus monticola]
MDVPQEYVRTFEVLHQQYSIRSALPLRTLCVCVDCRHPKVVNLDLKRLRQRNRNIKALVSLGSLYAGHGEPSAFKVFSTVFRQAKLEPDYVCGRCESTRANEQPVTFCPECGEMCSDSSCSRARSAATTTGARYAARRSGRQRLRCRPRP